MFMAGRLAHHDRVVPHRPKVRLVLAGPEEQPDGVMNFRRVLLVAVALGLLIAMLGVGRAQAAEPGASAWTAPVTDTRPHEAGSRIGTSVSAYTIRVADLA